MKIKVYMIVSDTDDGTQAEAYGAEAPAVADYVEIVNQYVEKENLYRGEDDQLPIAETFEQAAQNMVALNQDCGCIDTIIFDVQEIEVEI